MIEFNGGLIGFRKRPSPAASQPGVWTLGEQVTLRREWLWPPSDLGWPGDPWDLNDASGTDFIADLAATFTDLSFTDTTSTFGSVGTGSNKWYGGVLAPNGKIYCVPFSSTSVLAIDPSNDTTSTFGSLSGSLKWSGGVLAPNGKIYCVPRDSASVLAIDPSNDTTSTFGSLSGVDKWFGGVLAPNGKIYCVPLSSASVLRISDADYNIDLDVALSRYLNKF